MRLNVQIDVLHVPKLQGYILHELKILQLEVAVEVKTCQQLDQEDLHYK